MQEGYDVSKHHTRPAPTAASRGHAAGAAATAARARAATSSYDGSVPHASDGGWKLPRFARHAVARVTAHMQRSV